MKKPPARKRTKARERRWRVRSGTMRRIVVAKNADTAIRVALARTPKPRFLGLLIEVEEVGGLYHGFVSPLRFREVRARRKP